jgi:hypothetical protein
VVGYFSDGYIPAAHSFRATVFDDHIGARRSGVKDPKNSLGHGQKDEAFVYQNRKSCCEFCHSINKTLDLIEIRVVIFD